MKAVKLLNMKARICNKVLTSVTLLFFSLDIQAQALSASSISASESSLFRGPASIQACLKLINRWGTQARQTVLSPAPSNKSLGYEKRPSEVMSIVGQLMRAEMVNGKGSKSATSQRTEEKFPVISEVVNAKNTQKFLTALESGMTYQELENSLSPTEKIELQKLAQSNILIYLFQHLPGNFTTRDKGNPVITDTEYTGKFGYLADHEPSTRDSTVESKSGFLDQVYRQLNIDSRRISDELENRLRSGQQIQRDEKLIERDLVRAGFSLEKAQDLIAAVTFVREGVWRFRKYEELVPFLNNNSPGPMSRHFVDSAGSELKGAATFKDSPNVAPGRTFVEAKMKVANSASRFLTAVDKVRFAISDSLIPEFRNIENFNSDKNFEQFKARLRVDLESYKRNKECINEFDQFMALWRMQMLSGFDFEPVGRVVYTRKAYSGKLEDGSEFQLTIDDNIFQLDSKTGAILQAFPFMDRRTSETYQYDRDTGYFVNRGNDGVVNSIFDYHSKTHYRVSKSGELIPTRDAEFLEPNKQVEIKVAVKYGDFSVEDFNLVPTLKLVNDARQMLIGNNKTLNNFRTRQGLGPLDLQKGKAADFRNAEVSNKYTVLLTDNLGIARDQIEFTLHTRSGKFISWDKQTGSAKYELEIPSGKIFTIPKNKTDRRSHLATVKLN